MYRRIEPFRNVLPYMLSNLPCHVLALVDTMAKDKKDRALRASTTDHSPKKSPFYNTAKLPSLLSTTTTDNVRCKIFNCKTDFNDLNKKEKKRAFITHFNLHTLEQRKTQIDPSYELNLNKLGCGICTLCHRLASKTSQGALHKHSCITNTPMSSQATLIPIQDTISNNINTFFKSNPPTPLKRHLSAPPYLTSKKQTIISPSKRTFSYTINKTLSPRTESSSLP